MHRTITILMILEFYAVLCIFWAGQDSELGSIPHGKTVQGVKDPEPRVAETRFRFPSRNQRADRTLFLEASQTSLHRGKHTVISISLVWRAEEMNAVAKYQFRNS